MPVLVIFLLCEKTPWPKATWWRSLLWLMVPTGEWSIIEGSMVTSNRRDGRTKKLRTQRNRTQREWTRRGRGDNHPSPSDNHPPTRLHHLNLPPKQHHQWGSQALKCPRLWKTILIQTTTVPKGWVPQSSTLCVPPSFYSIFHISRALERWDRHMTISHIKDWALDLYDMETVSPGD